MLELRYGLGGSILDPRRGRADVQRHARAHPPDREPVAEEAPEPGRGSEASRGGLSRRGRPGLFPQFREFASKSFARDSIVRIGRWPRPSCSIRFQGFTDGALGGYAAGVAARGIDGPAEANLRALPPLDRELTLAGGDDGARELHDGEALVLEVRPVSSSRSRRPRAWTTRRPPAATLSTTPSTVLAASCGPGPERRHAAVPRLAGRSRGAAHGRLDAPPGADAGAGAAQRVRLGGPGLPQSGPPGSATTGRCAFPSPALGPRCRRALLASSDGRAGDRHRLADFPRRP